MALFINNYLVDSLTYNGNPIMSGAFSGDPYEDSWAYRLSDGTWQFGGEDCDENDGTYLVYTSGCPYPLCPPPPVTYTVTMNDSWGDGWDGASWTATSTSSGTVFGPYTVSYSQGTTNTESFTTSESCFTFVVGGGSFASEHTWTLDSAGVQIDAGGDPYAGNFGACTYGCTDPAFDNYDASIDFDNGSCADTPTL